MSKFCGNCGAQLDDSMRVCGYCGTPCETFAAPAANPVVNPTMANTQSSGSGKEFIAAIVVVCVIVASIFSLSSFSFEECDWCGGNPTKKFKTNDGDTAYVCSECRKECFFCGEKASKHYENLLGMIVFVCKDCYIDISD